MTNLYRELLGREPDPQGLASWLASLGQTGDTPGLRARIVQSFLNSSEYAGHWVSCVYETFLQRAPDAGGLQFWAQQLGRPGSQQGPGEQAVLAALVSSPEYVSLHGGANDGWIEGLYQDVLGRIADAGGSTFWLQLANAPGMDRTQFARVFLSSTEAVHKLLNANYPATPTSASLPAPGTPAAGAYALAALTGGGWENLFVRGNVPLASQPADAFFAELAGQAPWEAVVEQMLSANSYFNVRPTF